MNSPMKTAPKGVPYTSHSELAESVSDWLRRLEEDDIRDVHPDREAESDGFVYKDQETLWTPEDVEGQKDGFAPRSAVFGHLDTGDAHQLFNTSAETRS